MPSYCCFLDPSDSYEERELHDKCPQCGRPYGFPLTDCPAQVDKYKIIKPLARGFYSAAFVAEVNTPFVKKCVLKIASKKIYDFFQKDFNHECQLHHDASDGSRHIVSIYSMQSDVEVKFGDTVIPCHIAELGYIEGDPLSEFFSSEKTLPAIEVAQIAIDLFTLMSELQNKKVYHNDLHAGNLMIQKLDHTNKRADAYAPFINLVAIDLNSLADASKSDPTRLGDLRWVVKHLKMLVGKLLQNPDQTREFDYRLASVLEEQSYLLVPDPTAQRLPTFDECIASVGHATRQPRSPWVEPMQLRRFSDSYNAQTLEPWFVPFLLVDPDGQWLSAISSKGPQLITGLRGCGKTMLLKALEFHARVKVHQNDGGAAVSNRLRSDGYVGIYASSNKLLEYEVAREVRNPFEKIYVAYATEALRIINHLQELDSNVVFPAAYRQIGKAVSEYLGGAENLQDTPSDFALENALLSIAVELNRGSNRYSLNASPSLVFQHLADAIANCSPIWQNSTIFFLLDDVSTRYLSETNINNLMSSLIFSNPRCAFKITTEAQTFELILRSPGLMEQAREGRDYSVFDLGAKVLDLTRKKGNSGNQFIDDILSHRAKYYPQSVLSGLSAKVILGDTSLRSIAMNIGRTADTSAERKRVYWGISALTAACVGDIGDVIRIYETMFDKNKKMHVPIDPQTQTQCYHEFSNARTHDLNRKSSWLKDHTLAFAQASYDLLMQSYKDFVANGNQGRLRQYLKIYIRITVGNTDTQLNQIRDLIDHGIFVLDGGTFRKKTRDADPVRQFILTFRKLYGLSSSIGLSERDRFELSGTELEAWLSAPNKDILKRNLEKESEPQNAQDEEYQLEKEKQTEGQLRQTSLWEHHDAHQKSAVAEHPQFIERLLADKTPVCQEINAHDLLANKIDTLLLGLGFEDRTLASTERLLSYVKPDEVICIKHKERGRAEEIYDLTRRIVSNPIALTFSEFRESSSFQLVGNILIDITGLSKPMIFHSVRNAVLSNKRVIICHTGAEQYYPLDEDIAKVLEAEQQGNYYVLLEAMSSILTGENRPYSLIPLLKNDYDNTRRRMLLAFASAKHERLLTLLDERPYENIQIIAQSQTTYRGKLARLSSEFAAQNYPNAEVLELETDDLIGAVDKILRTYQCWYVDKGFNFEVGLTGSKIQAVAAAAASAVLKYTQCWYVSPEEFDSKRFTRGAGSTRFFEIILR